MIFFPFLISWTRTHFLIAELGCLASTPTFSRTIPARNARLTPFNQYKETEVLCMIFNKGSLNDFVSNNKINVLYMLKSMSCYFQTFLEVTQTIHRHVYHTDVKEGRRHDKFWQTFFGYLSKSRVELAKLSHFYSN